MPVVRSLGSVQLLRFAWVEAQCCLFAVLFFAGLALVRLVALPGSPADALLIWCLAVTLGLWLAGWETGREVAVIFGFNFFTSHVIRDLRLALSVALLAVTWRAWVRFTVGRRRYAMPMPLSFVLIGFFLWLAENAATLLRAWQYPHQEAVWSTVHAAKLGSWSLLVVVSIVLVAAVKSLEGRLYGAPSDLSVLRAYDVPEHPLPPVRARGVPSRP